MRPERRPRRPAGVRRAAVRALLAERGQDVVEYAAVIVLVALLIAGLSATDLPGKVSHSVGCALGQIFGGGGCGASGASGASTAGASGLPRGRLVNAPPASTLTAQPCPTGGGSASSEMHQYLTDPHGVTTGGVTLLAPSAPPPGLQCALSGGGAAGGFTAWTPGSGLAGTPKQAYVLNTEVAKGDLPPMPRNWDQMTPAQRNAFECQASQVFSDLSCGVGLDGPARLDQSIFPQDTTQTTSSGPSVTGVLGDLAPLAVTALQQLCAPECDANPALDSTEAEQDARSLADLGDQIAGDSAAVTPLTITGADEAAAAQDAEAAAGEESSAPPIKPGSAGGPTSGKQFPSSVRQDALGENPDTCVYCRIKTKSPQVDHAIPRSKGGNATLDNAQTACEFCNKSKGNRPFPVNPPPGYEGPFPPPWWEGP